MIVLKPQDIPFIRVNIVAIFKTSVEQILLLLARSNLHLPSQILVEVNPHEKVKVNPHVKVELQMKTQL